METPAKVFNISKCYFLEKEPLISHVSSRVSKEIKHLFDLNKKFIQIKMYVYIVFAFIN